MTAHIQGMHNGHRAQRITPFPREQQQEAIPSSLTLALELTNRLQTTLELDSLIELFVEGIKPVLDYAGASYQAPGAGDALSFGGTAQHSVSYDLKLLEENLGSFRFSRKSPYTRAETELLENLLATLLYPLRNALLYRQAVRSAFMDALTGVKNRAAFDGNIEREIELCRRKSTELSLIVLDIDFFKRVNDRYGHTVGDLVLKNVAQAVEATIRLSDALYRFGGEEFVVVLNGTDRQGAELLAQRIRQNVEALVFAHPQGLRVTMSLGVASLTDRDTSKTLFARADSALYQAKQGGRNQVVIAD